MKSIPKISVLCFMFLIALMVVLDVNSVTNRKDELEDSITISMRNTLKSSNVNVMYEMTDEEMQAEYIRNLAETINTDSTLDVFINEASVEGILDVKLRSSFRHLNGLVGSRETRKTLIYESFDKRASEVVQTIDIGEQANTVFAKFYKDGTLEINGSGTIKSKSYSNFLSTEYEYLNTQVKSIKIVDNVFAPRNSNYLFKGFVNATKITGLNNLNVSNTALATNMFFGCANVSELNFSTWNTSNFTNVDNMLYGCTKLKIAYVSNWDVSKIVSAQGMLYNCKDLIDFDVSKWNTIALVNANNMLSGCENLEYLDVSNWSVPNLESASNMLRFCKKLKVFDASKWYMPKIKDITNMLSGCEDLKRLDFSNAIMPNVKNMSGMLSGCEDLEYLDVTNLQTSNVVSVKQFLYRCLKLQTVKGLEDFNMSSLEPMTTTDKNDIFYLVPNTIVRPSWAL